MTFDEMLAEFMEAYPWKIAPLEVKRQLGKALHEDTWDNIIAGVRAYAEHSEHVAKGYIQHPARWLKEGNWMVEYEPKPHNVGLPDYAGSRRIVEEIKRKREQARPVMKVVK